MSRFRRRFRRSGAPRGAVPHTKQLACGRVCPPTAAERTASPGMEGLSMRVHFNRRGRAFFAAALAAALPLAGERGKVPSFDAKHNATVLSIDFSSDGDRMASCDRGGETIIWNLWSGEPEVRFQPAEGVASYCVRYNADGSKLATANHDGKL